MRPWSGEAKRVFGNYSRRYGVVRSFVEAQDHAATAGSCLVCNADLQVVSSATFTDDGVEMTFRVNRRSLWHSEPGFSTGWPSGAHRCRQQRHARPGKHTGMPDLSMPAPPTSRTRPPIQTRRREGLRRYTTSSCATCSSPTNRPPPRSRENRA